VLTLYLVPAVYTLFDALGARIRSRKKGVDPIEALGMEPEAS